jgi:hypothetical protein
MLMPCQVPRKLCHSFLVLAFTALCVSQVRATEICPNEESSAIVASIVRHELATASTQGRWMFTSAYNRDGVSYVARKIQTDDGIFTWILSRNGIPLSATENSTQRSSLSRLVSDPDYLEQNRKAMRDDATKINTLLADLPTSVHFHCLTKTATIADVAFDPKPDYAPWNVEQRVIAAMSGTLRLDMKEMRLLEATGVLQNDLPLFLGFGKIYKGSSVSLKRAETSTAAWETTLVSTHIKGQVFFLKTIAQDRDEVRSNYCLVQPDKRN